jgi:CubicO group peptidase (beta-lactamase class C family)
MMHTNLRFSTLSLIFISVLLNFTACNTAQKPATNPPKGQPTGAEFRAMLEETRAEYDLPGLAATVFTRNEIMAEDAVGVRNSDTKTRLIRNEKFHIGSCTQGFTVWVVAKLVEQGKLAWTSKPADVLGLRNNLRADYQDITLQDLLSHEARIAPVTSEKALAEAATFRQGTLQENRRAFVQHILRQEPYTGKDDAAADYTIAAAMCEKITDETWENLVNTTIFQPLNMKGEFGTLALRQKAAIYGHQFDTITKKWQPYASNEPMIPQVLSPNSDIDLTIGDYTKFLQENLKGLKGEASLLNAKTVKYIHNYQKDKNTSNQLGWSRAVATNGKDIMTYSQSKTGYFSAQSYLFHRRNMGIAVFANCNDDQDKTNAAIADLLRKIKVRYALD